MFAILPAGTGKTILLIQRYANRLRTLFYVLGNIFTILLKIRHRTENETNLWRSGLTPVALGNTIVNGGSDSLSWSVGSPPCGRPPAWSFESKSDLPESDN